MRPRPSPMGARAAGARAAGALAAALLLGACATAQVQGQGSATPGRQRPELVEVGPGMHSVRGELVGFDPANASLDLRLPPARPAPLVIFVHGAGGAGDNANAMDAIHAAGVGVLGFDAYRMNGLERPSGFWVRNVTYEARQRMILASALGAYRWAIAQPGVDARRIHVYGLSNGADVAANLAAMVDPAHVRTVFAEGLAGAGLGLPDRLAVPLRAIFGRLDNYAGTAEDDWRWQRRVPCRLNMAGLDGPPGNAAGCNAQANPAGLTQSPGDWALAQRARGADVELWFYEGGAHGMFLGPLRRRTMEWPGQVLHASTGAEDGARRRLLADVLARIADAR